MKNNYDDIINLPHHTSLAHPRMSIEARTAQFAPFAALTGYDDAVRETARITSDKIELEEDEKIILNNRLQLINENIKNKIEVNITYFISDSKKSGGKYVTKKCIIKKIDMVNQCIILEDKSKIYINNIFDINGDIFNLTLD